MAAMASARAGELASALMDGQSVALEGVDLKREDVEIEFAAKEGFAAAGDRVGVVVLDTRIDAELLDRGLVNELVNRVQAARKEMGLEYADRIRVSILGSERVRVVVDAFSESIAAEVLAIERVGGHRRFSADTTATWTSTASPFASGSLGRQRREREFLIRDWEPGRAAPLVWSEARAARSRTGDSRW